MRQRIDPDCERCQAPAPAASVLAGRLRLSGHQVTAPRSAVLEAVAARRRPFTAGDLCAAVTVSAPGVGRATVFRTLDLLVAERLVDRLYSLGPHVSYVARDPDPAPRAGGERVVYLVCALCHGVQEIEDEDVGAALRRAAARHAWPAEGTLVEILGRCPVCPDLPAGPAASAGPGVPAAQG